FPMYNVTEFLRALAYFLSNALTLRGSQCAHIFWHKVACNPTELIGEFHEFRLAGSKSLNSCDVQVADCLRNPITELRSFLCLRYLPFFIVWSHLPSLPMHRGHQVHRRPRTTRQVESAEGHDWA